jgi:uncharacterized protein (TIGR03067 family)
MRKGILLTAMAVAVSGLALAEDAKKDLAKLEGTWEASSAIHDGKETDAEALKKLKLTVKDGNYTLDRGKDTLKGTLKVDSSKTPRTIDAVRADGSAIHGIYELSGDVFKVCFAGPKKDRPTEFTAKEGTGNQMTVWKRAK